MLKKLGSMCLNFENLALNCISRKYKVTVQCKSPLGRVMFCNIDFNSRRVSIQDKFYWGAVTRVASPEWPLQQISTLLIYRPRTKYFTLPGNCVYMYSQVSVHRGEYPFVYWIKMKRGDLSGVNRGAKLPSQNRKLCSSRITWRGDGLYPWTGSGVQPLPPPIPGQWLCSIRDKLRSFYFQYCGHGGGLSYIDSTIHLLVVYTAAIWVKT